MMHDDVAQQHDVLGHVQTEFWYRNLSQNKSLITH